MRRLISFFSGVIMGSLVGAAVALILAPSSGDELRSEIQTRYIEIRDEVESAAQNRRAELEAQLESLRKPRKAE